MLVLVRLAIVVEWIDDGDVALDGHWNHVVRAHVRGHLQERRESGEQDVIAAWVVEHMHNDQQRCVPEQEDAGYDVGQ